MSRKSNVVVAATFGLWAACAPPDLEAPPPEPKFHADDPASYTLAEELSMQHFRDQPQLLAGVEAIWTRDVAIDELGKAHTRVGQSIDGIPVFGAEAIVHLDDTGAVEGVTDGFERHLQVDTRANIAASRAIELAVASRSHGIQLGATPTADLVVLRRGKDALVYRVQLDFVESGRPSRPVVFVDAKSGGVVWSYENLQTARNREVHNLNHGTSLPGPIARTETGPASGDTDVDTNYLRLGSTYDCYSQLFNRDSFDNAGAKLISSVHYSNNYVNAFWNGTQMVYGDGDNVNSRSLAISMDVTAHELTHAVTERTSGLIYSGESGGLNEAYSDIFGNTCEWFRDNNGNVSGPTSANTWMVGEDIWLADPALRYMNDPARDGASLDFWTSSAGNVDVHYSSGIANLAFYLAANGGQHPRGKSTTVVSGIGIYDASRAFYRANTTYLTPSSNFGAARLATVNAATDLFGASSNQVAQIKNAWTAVGVMEPPDYHVIDTRTNLSSSTQLDFSYPTNGATAMKFVTSGGTGDADLYVRFGSPPTLSAYDCRPYTASNNESCEFNPAQSGTYYVMIQAYAAYSGVTLTTSAGGGGGPTTETSCTDGQDNDGDGNVDCSDSDCASAPSCQVPTDWVVISNTNFESGLGAYTDGGGDAARVNNSAVASSGNFSMQIRDNTGAASSFFTTTGMNLSTRSQIRIQYSALAQSMENGESYVVELQVNGGAYQAVGTFAAGSGFTNNVRQNKDLQIPISNATSVRVRFRCNASNNSDFVYIDDVVISAR